MRQQKNRRPNDVRAAVLRRSWPQDPDIWPFVGGIRMSRASAGVSEVTGGATAGAGTSIGGTAGEPLRPREPPVDLRAVLLRAVRFAGDRRAVVLRAVLLRAVLLRAVLFLAADLRAVVFLAVDLRAVLLRAVLLRAVLFLAADLRA